MRQHLLHILAACWFALCRGSTIQFTATFDSLCAASGLIPRLKRYSSVENEQGDAPRRVKCRDGVTLHNR